MAVIVVLYTEIKCLEETHLKQEGRTNGDMLDKAS